MSNPYSPGGIAGGGGSGDYAVNNSIAEALIRRYTSACMEASSTDGLSSLKNSSSLGGAGSDAGGGASAASTSASSSYSRIEDIRRKYGSLLDALAAIAPTHAIVLVET